MKKETKNLVARTAKTIADAISNAEGAKTKYTKAIADCERKASATEDKMIAATSTDDTKAYIAAKREKEETEAEREMYMRKLNQIETEGLMSDASVKQIVDDLKAAEQEEFMVLVTEVRNMAAKLIELKHEYDEALGELNNLNGSIPMIKPGAVNNPLVIRIGNPAFSFAGYAEQFLQNAKF